MSGASFAPRSGRTTVYGAALNYRSQRAALRAAFEAAPYVAPPRAPVLYIRPENTWSKSGEVVPVSPAAPEFVAGATVGAVIGRDLWQVPVSEVAGHVAGIILVDDLVVPHDDFYRPPLAQLCRDRSCVLGGTMLPVDASRLGAPFRLSVAIDGRAAHVVSTADCVRPLDVLIADVAAMFTLRAGDVVLLGTAPDAPRVRAGQAVCVSAEGLGEVRTTLVAAAGVPS